MTPRAFVRATLPTTPVAPDFILIILEPATECFIGANSRDGTPREGARPTFASAVLNRRAIEPHTLPAEMEERLPQRREVPHGNNPGR